MIRGEREGEGGRGGGEKGLGEGKGKGGEEEEGKWKEEGENWERRGGGEDWEERGEDMGRGQQVARDLACPLIQQVATVMETIRDTAGAPNLRRQHNNYFPRQCIISKKMAKCDT